MKSILKLFTSIPNLSIIFSAAIALLCLQERQCRAGEWIPLKMQGIVTIQSVMPIAGDSTGFVAEVLATDLGWGTHFGYYSSEFRLIVEFNAEGVPLRGEGIIVQTNADGSTVQWFNSFGASVSTSIIIGGTGRFEHAQGWISGALTENEDGTVSYDEEGQITSIGSHRGKRRGS